MAVRSSVVRSPATIAGSRNADRGLNPDRAASVTPEVNSRLIEKRSA
ncbi:hypothetical protein [Microcoleus sp. herbarium14]